MRKSKRKYIRSYRDSSSLTCRRLDSGAKDDGQKFFRNGLRDIQRKLDERIYTSALLFATDLQSVFATAIACEVASDPQASGNLIAQSTFSRKQKDMRNSARRINRGIQPKLVDVQRKEAELCGRPLDPADHINVDALFEDSLRAHQGSVVYSGNGDLTDRGTDAGRMSPSKAPSVVNTIEVNGVEDNTEEGTANAPLTNGITVDVDMVDAPESADTVNANSVVKQDHVDDKDETTDEAIIRLQLEPGGPTIPIANDDADQPHKDSNAKPTTSVSSSNSAITAPALSSSDSTNPSINATDPPTPPQHTNGTLSPDDPAGPLHDGGVMWYLEGFSPRGTTIHDERWGGRDALREMSEELSELGSDALEDLIDPDNMELDTKPPADNAASANGNLAPPVPQKKKAAKKGRRSQFGRRVR